MKGGDEKMCCPNCESDYLKQWIVADETTIHTDSNGKGWFYIVRGCECNECRHTWYEHYTGTITDFYWTNN